LGVPFFWVVPFFEEAFSGATCAPCPRRWFSVICRLAELDGVDLWRFHTDKGIGVEKCFEYLMPYLLRPDSWRKQQIADYSPNGYIFPALAALGLHSPELLSAYKKLPRAGTPWVQFIDLLTQTGSA
jgi:hypothetical protein